MSILVPEIKAARAALICDKLKAKINNYFSKHKVENVFINLGILSFSQKNQDPTTYCLLSNLCVKKIVIGSEVRRYKRYDYCKDIQVFFPDKSRRSFKTVDISKGGLCFLMPKSSAHNFAKIDKDSIFDSEVPFKTDSLIKVKLRASTSKSFLSLAARVAWVKAVDEDVQSNTKHHYKIGLEFDSLSKDQKKKIIDLIASLSLKKKAEKK